jgi:hypothetical protein
MLVSFAEYLNEKAPPGWDKWVEKVKPSLVIKYGEKKGAHIAFGRAWNLEKQGTMPGKSWKKTLSNARKIAKKSGVLKTRYGRSQRLHSKSATKARAIASAVMDQTK